MILSASIHNIINMVKIIVIVIIGIVILGAVVFVYLYKLKKSRVLSAEEEVDYSKLNRFDTKDYVKFNDIKEGIIILDNGYTFTAGIIAYASGDFWSLPPMERLAVKKGYQSFISTISSPIMYKHTSRAIDLEWQIKRYQKRLNEIEKNVINMSMDYEELKAESQRVKTEGNYEGLELLVNAMEKLSRNIDVENARIKHLKDQIEYQQALSNGISATDHEQVYLFSWSYVPKIGEAELTKTAIFEKAKIELRNRARVHISALSNAKVKARRCSQTEMEILVKRHFHPITGSFIKYGDYINNSDFEDIVQADDTQLYEDARAEALDNLDLRIGMETFIEEQQDSVLDNTSETEKSDATAKNPKSEEKPAEDASEADEIYYLSGDDNGSDDESGTVSQDKNKRHYNKEEKHIKRGAQQ